MQRAPRKNKFGMMVLGEDSNELTDKTQSKRNRFTHKKRKTPVPRYYDEKPSVSNITFTKNKKHEAEDVSEIKLVDHSDSYKDHDSRAKETIKPGTGRVDSGVELQIQNSGDEPAYENSKSGQKKETFKANPGGIHSSRYDPFPGDAPVPSSKIKKYERGTKPESTYARTKFAADKMKSTEKKVLDAARTAARTESLLQEQAGFLEVDDDEDFMQVTQRDIVDAVDITSAHKHFELSLKQFGPYRLNYTRNGRFLLLGGGRGHVAAIDWLTKKLLCEINVMEAVHDVRWLHQETMFAVAQKQWTYIYDNQGIELHCLKTMDSVLRLEFLPYHFLLASASSKGYLTYLDVSIGQKVVGIATGHGRLDVMCQNPQNAILHLGHSGGTVTLWSPNVKEPLVKMLCHGSGVRSIAVDNTGQYMATSGIDGKLKIWDLRTYKTLYSYKIASGAGSLAFSQKGMLAAGIGNIVEVYKDCCRSPDVSPYLNHHLQSTVQGLQFCPFEDVLGVSHGEGFASLLIPGSGEANFDALEANPYQTKKQRRQAEVKMLLEKIQPEMIHLESRKIVEVNKKSLLEKNEERNKALHLKPRKVDFEPKFKKKGRSKSLKVQQRKDGVQQESTQKMIREANREKQNQERENVQETNRDAGVLDRFHRKMD